jgi:hypothetical protein
MKMLKKLDRDLAQGLTYVLVSKHKRREVVDSRALDRVGGAPPESSLVSTRRGARGGREGNRSFKEAKIFARGGI